MRYEEVQSVIHHLGIRLSHQRILLRRVELVRHLLDQRVAVRPVQVAPVSPTGGTRPERRKRISAVKGSIAVTPMWMTWLSRLQGARTPAEPRTAARMEQAMYVNGCYLLPGVANVIGRRRVVGPKLPPGWRG